MNRIFFLIISALALTSCASTGIKTSEPLPQSYKYSKVEYRSEMQQYFKKELPEVNDPLFEIIQSYYNKIQTEEQFKKACKNASISVKAAFIRSDNKITNGLYLKHLMDILDDKDKQMLKNQVLLDSNQYDLFNN